MSDMIPIPLDAEGLQRIEDALNVSYAVDEDGTHSLVGGDFTLSTLLDWYSGYDESKLIHEGTAETFMGEVEMTTYPEPVYHPNDLIRVLVEEIRELRTQLGKD